MKNKKKLTFGDIALLVAPFVYLLAVILYDILYLKDDPSGFAIDLVNYFFFFIAALGCAISYIKHDKNVMKFLVGGLIVSCTNSMVTIAVDLAVYPDYVWLFTLYLLEALGYLALFFGHIVLSTNHKSRRGFAISNQIIAVVLALLSIASRLGCMYFYGTGLVYVLICSLMEISLTYVIVYIEAKIDYFKVLRDKKEALEK